ncbi:MAG TPA: hypothetical protein VGF99_13640, partial [Myxococcota bacterium]
MAALHIRVAATTLALAGVVSFFGCDGGAPVVDQPDDTLPPRGDDPWCSTRPALAFFCEDFDENPLPGSFDDVVEENGTVALSDDVESPPNSLRVAVADDADNDSAAALLRASFGPGIKHRLFERMKLDTPNANVDDAVDVVGLDFTSETAAPYRIGVRVDGAGVFSAYEQIGDDEPTVFPIAATIAPETWTTVRMDVFFNDELSPPGACNELGAFLLLKFRDDTVVDCQPLSPPDTQASPAL